MTVSQFMMTNFLLLTGTRLLLFNHYGKYNKLIKLSIFAGLYVIAEPLIVLSSAIPSLFKDAFAREVEK